jgi:hypothetical protein
MEMLKRKDGSTSRRGLWDNIRAAKGSGKKPTAAMLKQEKKIKAKKAKDGDTVERGMTSEVKVRPSFKSNVKNDMRRAMSTDSTDYQNTPAKTTAGKILRGANKVASTVARGAMAPIAAATSVAGNAMKALSNANKARKEEKGYKKNGGMLKPVDKTKKPGLAKLPTAVRNKMGFKKNGGTMSKKK